MSKQVESNVAADETSTADEQKIIVCKIATTTSLSGLSQLVYHVGAGTTDQPLIRIWNNSGGGKFNQDWISLSAIQSCIPPTGTFKASIFNSLLPGKSTNTPGFIAAACLAERLIGRSEKEARQYELNDWTNWRNEIEALISAGTNLEVTAMEKPAGHSESVESKAKPTKKKPAGVLAQPVQ